jgi:hypothetical protein
LSRGQFDVRFLFALMFVAALSTWWYVQPRPEGISRYDANRIKVGMTDREVHLILKGPVGGGSGHGVGLLVYRAQAPFWASQDLFFFVYFID